MIYDVYYLPKAKVTKEHVRKKVAQQFKKQNVVIFSAKKALVEEESDDSQWFMILKIQ